MANPILVRVDREIASLVPRFLGNCKRDAGLIGDAVAKSDLDTARRIGHSLKGVGGGYGFPEITRLGAVIEAAAKANDAAAVLAGAKELATYLGSIEVVYE